MKLSSRQILLAVIALALGAGAARYLVRNASEKPEAAPSPSAPAPAAPAPSLTGSAAPVSEPRSVPAAASQPVSTAGAPLLQGDAAHEAIQDLVVTYEPAAAAAIARYLRHSDREIREAARDGLIQLGERAAIPFLQEAAKTAPAEEAVALREAAEFLALPTWREQRAAQEAARP